jgi:hypothetical protein
MAYPDYLKNKVTTFSQVTYSGRGTLYQVTTLTGKIYEFYIDVSNDPGFRTSTDYGQSWSAFTALKATTCTMFSIWYDRWTDPTGGLGDYIHCAYADSGSDDVFYRTIDTSNADTLGTERTPFAGSSTASGCYLSITRTRGGNVIIGGTIDAGVELFCYKTANLGVNWSSIAAVAEATNDQMIMMPGWGADNQDAMCFFWDNDATEISVKYYDDSANSWSEASIATSVTNTTTGQPQFAAAVDHTNSQNLLVFWTITDTANADLRCFKVTQSAQTETASNVVLNSTDDQGMCGIVIDKTTEDWYVFYIGKSDGTETYNSSVNIYYKISTDDGATWGSETALTTFIDTYYMLLVSPIIYTKRLNITCSDNTYISHICSFRYPRINSQLGL